MVGGGRFSFSSVFCGPLEGLVRMAARGAGGHQVTWEPKWLLKGPIENDVGSNVQLKQIRGSGPSGKLVWGAEAQPAHVRTGRWSDASSPHGPRLSCESLTSRGKKNNEKNTRYLLFALERFAEQPLLRAVQLPL